MTALLARKVGSIPLLISTPKTEERPLPTVLWFHGLGVAKETHEKELRQLAKAGFLAVGVDAAGHGERTLPSLKERVDRATQNEALRLMLPLVELTARDVPAIVQRLAHDGLADERRIALAGISMGAFVVYRAITIVQGIRAAVALLGSPEWPEGISPHWHADRFRETALLSITAERDTNVPPAAARRFHEQLRHDPELSAPVQYLEVPGAGHLMDERQWTLAFGEAVAWLQRFNL